MVEENPPGCALTCAAQARKSPVVNARMIRCAAGGKRFMISGTVGARAGLQPLAALGRSNCKEDDAGRAGVT